ncbi:Leucine-rich repeat-containing protein 40-like [Oopsacas minuta]|uniref:Leucine-rich repeat-containing protein 40-like n=1 Tax=Oopsacas minuta TaxID=111878 RepID=A0AAV7K4W0_9METZ|nr:Leucine-rich repeat-containing protein 40-like [Oopsacas minuta]
MFQAIKNLFSSSSTAPAYTDGEDNNNNNTPPTQIAEDSQIVDLSNIVRSTEEFEEILQKHSNSRIITRLTLTGTTTTGLPAVIGKFVNITQLNLSSNQISLLPWSIFYLQELEYLNLSNNRIVELPKTLGYLKKLIIFDLRDNMIQFVPSELVLLDSLSNVFLEGNLSLMSPPADNLPADVLELKTYLANRYTRTDAFISCRYYYTVKTRIASLVDLTVRCIMEYKLEYLSCIWMPPNLKHQIHKEENDRQTELHVMKCTKCKNYFSSKKTFEVHHC